VVKVYKYLDFAGKVIKNKAQSLKFPKAFPKNMSRMLPLPAAKTWDPKNQACNAVYAICMSEARKGTAATAESIIRNIKYSPALEMTTLKMVMRAISKAIMDVYDEALVLDGETEKQHMDRIYIELTAMEEAKEYFEKMAKF
jgi:hypothetical protein